MTALTKTCALCTRGLEPADAWPTKLGPAHLRCLVRVGGGRARALVYVWKLGPWAGKRPANENAQGAA